jgi:hypothetical protein
MILVYYFVKCQHKILNTIYGTMVLMSHGNVVNNLVSNVLLNNSENIMHWDLEKSTIFTTKLFYRFILNPGIRDLSMMAM